MRKSLIVLFLLSLIFTARPGAFRVHAIEIDRFEHINTDDGLSQNTVTSLHCDHKGFLWIGTMNGLNRYDGYNFKIYRNKPGKTQSLTHNRVISIWEDARYMIWFETYDGYYHYFDPQREYFTTLPKYSVSQEEKFSKITCFLQYSNDEIWLGSSNSGVYYLKYNEAKSAYDEKQFLSRGQFSISNNNIGFIISDDDRNIWIGTSNGLNLLKNDDYQKDNFFYQHFFSGIKFTSAAANGDHVWFGTQSNGVVVYDLKSKSFTVFNAQNSEIGSAPVSIIRAGKNGNMIIGSDKIFIVKNDRILERGIPLDRTLVDKIYEDREGLLWVTTQKFGVHRVDQNTGMTRFFDLTPSDYKYLSDRERPYFFEDSENNFWICVHGGGLVQYIRGQERFRFYRNDPTNPNSISSNTVMCMTEDHNGTLWVGTSLQGGLNKIIVKNPAISSRQPHKQYVDFVENIVRSLMQDVNGNIWVGTKGGDLIVYNPALEPVRPALRNPFGENIDPVSNVYAMVQDSKGHIWLGSKGAGIAVSKFPVRKGFFDYSRIEWYNYNMVSNDETSIVDDNIYSISEDKFGRIWIGTYGKGICYTVLGKYDNLKFRRITSLNSNLSSDQVRNLFVDGQQNLWVSTIFGINQLSLKSTIPDTIIFRNYIHNPADYNSLVYNDVVHGFEDSKGNLWFGTFGGGVNRIQRLENNELRFECLDESSGLTNDEVFGILEDEQGYIWFSTENGLSRFDPESNSFENFNKSNGLSSNGFSENTCLKLADGRLVFGHSLGFEVVDPKVLKPRHIKSAVTFTNFQLFNINIDVHSKGSPLKKSISYSDEIVLKYNQSSFSIEYSALNYLDESKTQYAYILDDFDKTWNYVGTDRKATYTNLKPGKYLFRVKSALWNGQWDKEETVMKIVILPPWWGSTFAYIVYMILFIVLSFIASRIAIRIYTFRNELKIEKAVNEVKLQFFTNISHEIRTPLTLILGPIEDVLDDKALPDKFVAPLKLMQRNGKRMLHLLNQLLDFRKVQNKKMILHVTPVDVACFAKEIFKNFEAYARHRDVRYLFENRLGRSEVWIDPNRMDSVVFNILSNAFKFTPKGETINMTVEESPDGAKVHISIADNGPGISPKDIPFIFERYTILSDHQKISSGTGIGLHLSNEIVKLHGGQIVVGQGTEKGSLFTIVLPKGNEHLKNATHIVVDEFIEPQSFVKPLLSDLMPETQNELSDREEPEASSTKPVLLLVEDNVQILNYIESSLLDGYSILKCNNGQEALLLAAQRNPDLIVSDVMMPELDGISMTKALKADFNTCHIPVVLLTAKTAVDDQIHGIEAGAEAYVLKPFNMGVLKSILHNLLAQRKILLQKYRDKQDIDISDLKFTSRDQEFLDNLVKYIEKNYNDPELTINQLAEFSCVSRTVFYNKVKTLTGISPVEFLRQIKLKIAAKMLENGYNVSEAALNIGFNDTRYFSRQFKEFFGESPSQYKKRFTGIDEEIQ